MLISRLLRQLPRELPANVLAPKSVRQFHFKDRRIFNAVEIAKMKQKKAWQGRKRRREDAASQVKEGSNEEVLDFEVKALLEKFAEQREAVVSEKDKGKAGTTAPEAFTELELEIEELSSTGDGLALSPERDVVYVVPFTLPGDKVSAKILARPVSGTFVRTDFLKVLRASPMRKDSEINCKYFSECSGCQLQMLPYEDQLAHKKTIIEKAYKNFSGLSPTQIPPVGDTIGSPLRYEYRTKLTPHFDGPRGPKGSRRFEQVPPIGFAKKGRRQVMDIESCPIGTPIVQEGFKSERARVATTFDTFKNGATLLIRESTERTLKSASNIPSPVNTTPPLTDPQPTTIQTSHPSYTEIKTFKTSSSASSTEYVDDWIFRNTAGAFFQNNNSILSTFTAYVRSHILPPAPPLTTAPVKYLLDAYCGSGLFAVTLSPLFKSTLGIDIDSRSIEAARDNAAANGLAEIGFIEADAEALFAGVPFPASETAVVLDPPRKGCSKGFLKQLLGFAPKRVVYVSCNVHSQALDVGELVRGDLGETGVRYEIESIRGFDFFPQTAHVEGVTFLSRKD